MTSSEPLYECRSCGDRHHPDEREEHEIFVASVCPVCESKRAIVVKDYDGWVGDHRPLCDECGEEKEYVDEPMVSGFRGFLCVNEECPMDS